MVLRMLQYKKFSSTSLWFSMSDYSSQNLRSMYEKTSAFKKIVYMKKMMNFYAKHYLKGIQSLKLLRPSSGKSPLNWTADEITAFVIKASEKLNYENSTIMKKMDTVRSILRLKGNLNWEKNRTTWVMSLVFVSFFMF